MTKNIGNGAAVTLGIASEISTPLAGSEKVAKLPEAQLSPRTRRAAERRTAGIERESFMMMSAEAPCGEKA